MVIDFNGTQKKFSYTASLSSGYLTAEDDSVIDVYKRQVQEYRASTGFECLLGWLYLQGRNDRIQELFDALWEGYQPE